MYKLYAYMHDVWVVHNYMHPSNGIKVITQDLYILPGSYEMSHFKKICHMRQNKGFTILEYGKIWCSQKNKTKQTKQ